MSAEQYAITNPTSYYMSAEQYAITNPTIQSSLIDKLMDQDKVRRLRARKFLKVLKMDRFYRPLRAYGAVSRADFFRTALMDDQALFEIGMTEYDASLFRRALVETTPEDVEEFVCKCGLGHCLPRFLAEGFDDLEAMLEDNDEEDEDGGRSFSNNRGADRGRGGRGGVMGPGVLRALGLSDEEVGRFAKEVEAMSRSVLTVRRVSVSLAMGGLRQQDLVDSSDEDEDGNSRDSLVSAIPVAVAVGSPTATPSSSFPGAATEAVARVFQTQGVYEHRVKWAQGIPLSNDNASRPRDGRGEKGSSGGGGYRRKSWGGSSSSSSSSSSGGGGGGSGGGEGVNKGERAVPFRRLRKQLSELTGMRGVFSGKIAATDAPTNTEEIVEATPSFSSSAAFSEGGCRASDGGEVGPPAPARYPHATGTEQTPAHEFTAVARVVQSPAAAAAAAAASSVHPRGQADGAADGQPSSPQPPVASSSPRPHVPTSRGGGVPSSSATAPVPSPQPHLLPSTRTQKPEPGSREALKEVARFLHGAGLSHRTPQVLGLTRNDLVVGAAVLADGGGGPGGARRWVQCEDDLLDPELATVLQQQTPPGTGDTASSGGTPPSVEPWSAEELKRFLDALEMFKSRRESARTGPPRPEPNGSGLNDGSTAKEVYIF